MRGKIRKFKCLLYLTENFWEIYCFPCCLCFFEQYRVIYHSIVWWTRINHLCMAFCLPGRLFVCPSVCRFSIRNYTFIKNFVCEVCDLTRTSVRSRKPCRDVSHNRLRDQEAHGRWWRCQQTCRQRSKDCCGVWKLAGCHSKFQDVHVPTCKETWGWSGDCATRCH